MRKQSTPSRPPAALHGTCRLPLQTAYQLACRPPSFFNETRARGLRNSLFGRQIHFAVSRDHRWRSSRKADVSIDPVPSHWGLRNARLSNAQKMQAGYYSEDGTRPKNAAAQTLPKHNPVGCLFHTCELRTRYTFKAHSRDSLSFNESWAL